MPQDAIASIALDLAVKVLSESNTVGEMDRKRSEYFSSGMCLVWMVDSRERRIDVYSSAHRSVSLRSDQSIDGGVVPPCFEAAVGDFFVDLDLVADRAN